MKNKPMARRLMDGGTRKAKEGAYYTDGMSAMQEAMLRAQLRGVDLPDIVPDHERGQLWSPPDVEERPSVDRLGRFITIHDPAPPKCSVCSCELYPPAFHDYSGMTPEEVDWFDWDRENFRSVELCKDHPDARPIWPPMIEISYRFGTPGASIEINQGNEPAHPGLISPAGMQLLAKVLMRLESWIHGVQETQLANADRDHGDETKSNPWGDFK